MQNKPGPGLFLIGETSFHRYQFFLFLTGQKIMHKSKLWN